MSCANTAIPSNPFGAERPAPAVRLPPAVHLDVDGFTVSLDPTVELWAKQAHVDLSRVITTALKNIEGRLHGRGVPIEIEAGTYGTARALGIGGQTDPYTGSVQVSMDLGSSLPLKQLLTVWIPLSLAHELDHSKRILDGPGYGSTLGEVVVSEGAAEAFVREAYPGAPSIPWVQPLSANDERSVWSRLRTALTTPDDPVTYQHWFVGNEGGLPRWAGYRIGYEICEEYLVRHPGTNAVQLTVTSGNDVLKGSVR